MGKFKFGITKHQTLPFTLAGLTFFSKPLTVAEELPFADIGDRFDSENATPEQTKAFITEQAAYIADMLRLRLAPVAEGATPPLIDANWALRYTGLDTLPRLLDFLRSGQRPAEPLELVNWTDEPIEIDDLTFQMRRMSFHEQMFASEFPENGSAAEVVQASVKMLAALLNARLDAGGQDPRPSITPEWLQTHLTSDDMQQIIGLLQNGPEGDAPNAAETLDNLSFVAAGSTIS